MHSYEPKELSDEDGTLVPELRNLAPAGHRRMSANQVTNGGTVRKPLRMPDFQDYAVDVEPGVTEVSSMSNVAFFLRDVIAANMHNFRLFGPDETESNKLGEIYKAGKKVWMADMLPEDNDAGNLAMEGRVMEMLSEHTVEGRLELRPVCSTWFTELVRTIHSHYRLDGQHAKWFEVSSRIEWRAPIASLSILFTAKVWRQDHNGFIHQDPGFLDLVANKSKDVTRIYLPPDANCLSSASQESLLEEYQLRQRCRCLQATHLQYLDMESATAHRPKGVGIWEWASLNPDEEPDVVIAGCGDSVPREALAARKYSPDLKIRFVNVVDFFKLTSHEHHPHSLTEHEFDSLSTADNP